MKTDRRPDPKPRKHIRLWQAYLFWHEIMEMHKRHTLRLDAIEKGKSTMDASFEKNIMQIVGPVRFVKKTSEQKHLGMRGLKLMACNLMIAEGKQAGPVWDWLTSIKGLKSGSMAAQLVAQIDDISRSRTVSALWRYAGFSVVNGVAERNQKGVKSPFNRKLKGVCFLVADQFIKQNTPVYREIYDEEKERQYHKHPQPLCRECQTAATKKKVERDGKMVNSWSCPESGNHIVVFTPQHLHNRAWRKMIKIFLQHLWVVWREAEGLEVSAPYVQDVLGHTHIIAPTRAKKL